jgi:hypothetical protein
MATIPSRTPPDFSNVSCFGGALTDGYLWDFHVVVRDQKGQWQDYSLQELDANSNKPVIVQILAKMVRLTAFCDMLIAQVAHFKRGRAYGVLR